MVEADDSYRAGTVAAVPLAIAVGAFGVSFGVLAQGAGIGGFAAVLMSATTFAGSAQFAAVAVLAQGGGLATAVIAVALLNSRYLPIGASVASVLHRHPALRFLEAQMVVDESWAIGHVGGQVLRRRLLGAGVTIYAAWVIGTIAGVLGGRLLGDPARLGFDAAFPALFLALVVGQLRSRRAVSAALLGAAIALLLAPFTPPGIPILAAAAACLLGLRR
ncbi:MAG TPA: AzlC family ABC transporter permease [Candidatus Dormibacteraeota bacterium]|nr:AzlC family ABC transporter permease [Candidatus Dormibacteraeota bacterium]